jgi:hypothetical protein
MNKPRQTDEEALASDVSDEVLEAAGATLAGVAPTLMQASYCFTCVQEVLSPPLPRPA